ncbi:MAG: GGDEF domain-containing protein, partial [Chloroflexota bacterium]
MNRPLGESIVIIGGRLATALLPLAVFAAVHFVPALRDGTLLPWVAPAIAGAAAATAGLALLLAVAAALDSGRTRDLGDATGLGMLAVTFAVVSLGSTGVVGLGIGAVLAAAAFAAASASGIRVLVSRQSRTAGVIIGVVLVEACLAAVLLIGGAGDADSVAPILLVGAAIVLLAAATTAFDEPTRATALGIAATSSLALGLAAPDGGERLVGTAGIAVAAIVVGWSLGAHRLRRAPAEQEAVVEAEPESEFDELSRLTHELRGTIDDLVGARRTIELQRAEIERATTMDPLTGLPGRGPTLGRLRIDAAEARRYAHAVAVILLDIDRFADLNHEHGVEVGDAILREVALRLRLRIREADALGRIGGDSFLAVLPHTDEQGATTFASALLDRLMERRLSTTGGDTTIRLSIGIALMRPGMTLTGDELLADAEEALASAKAAGGNRIAFDRLHGLARLDERRDPDAGTEPGASS